MQNHIKSKTRLAVIQFVFLYLSKKNIDFIKTKKEFDDYFFGSFYSNISENKEVKIEYNKKLFNQLSNNFNEFYNNENLYKTLNNFIDFDRKFEKWDKINQAITICILSELCTVSKNRVKIVLNDYLNISKKFISIKEVKMINAIVDKYLNEKKIL